MTPWMTILGGSQSGKTDLAHAICAPFDEIVWWGTGSLQLQDSDWQNRLAALRASRKSSWQILDGPQAWLNQGESEFNTVEPDWSKTKIFVLDSLNLWLAAVLNQTTSRYSIAQAKIHLEIEFQHLIKSLRRLSCAVLVVTAEVGTGVVPPGEAARLFRDLLGAWNKSIVELSQYSVSMHAGRALLWPGGQSELPMAGAPVLCVDDSHLRRLLCPV